MRVERKEGIANGTIPDWMIGAGYQLFTEKYLWADSIKEQYQEIARTAAHWCMNTKWEEIAEKKFFNLMWNGWLSLSTPVLANMGSGRGLPVSCSGQYIEDSIDGFYSARRESAILTKNGFGTSGDFSAVRARGSKIRVGGVASGTLPVFTGFVRDMSEVAQGNNRRGAFAGYLPIMHGDFDELADLLHATPFGLNVGWIIPQSFIDDLDNNVPEAIRRYQKVLKVKMITGKGYFFFIDKANALRPIDYIDNDLDIKASNLCVAPETLVLTDAGHIEISSLVDQEVNVWNGTEWSKVIVRHTGVDQELVKVVTDSGQDLECTPQHKFYVVTDYSGNTVEKRAHELQKGDKLIRLSTPVIEGNEVLLHPYANGFYTGDGCSFKGDSIIYLYNSKQDLLDEFKDVARTVNVQSIQNRTIIRANGLQPKFFTPDSNYTIASRVEWLAGLLDSDGCLLTNGDSQTLQVASTEKEFLKEVQLMLQTLGVQSKVKHVRDSGLYNLPKNDGSNTLGLYACKDVYRILISGNGVNTLLSLGLNTRRLNITNHVPNRNCERFVTVQEVVYTRRRDNVYCFTEPKKHLGVFNGLLTGQCSEISLHSSKDYTYTCVLSSMNLAKYDEWKDTDAVYWSTIFLDCVVSEFLYLAEKIPGLEKAVAFTEKGRALGLGVCGLHTLFQKRGIPFESLDAQFLNDEIFRTLGQESNRASYDMAEQLGIPEWCQSSGRRNTHTMAIAPTKSTALIMGGVSEGINPDQGMTYTQTTAAGEVERINPVLLDIMKSRGVYDDRHVSDIVSAFGSVQAVDWLSAEEKMVFKTAFEIDQAVVLRLASQRQKYIDQLQSINLFFSAEAGEEYISKIHKMAFKDPNIGSLYYCYSKAGVSASDGCVVCQ